MIKRALQLLAALYLLSLGGAGVMLVLDPQPQPFLLLYVSPVFLVLAYQAIAYVVLGENK